MGIQLDKNYMTHDPTVSTVAHLLNVLKAINGGNCAQLDFFPAPSLCSCTDQVTCFFCFFLTKSKDLTIIGLHE